VKSEVEWVQEAAALSV